MFYFINIIIHIRFVLLLDEVVDSKKESQLHSLVFIVLFALTLAALIIVSLSCFVYVTRLRRSNATPVVNKDGSPNALHQNEVEVHEM